MMGAVSGVKDGRNRQEFGVACVCFQMPEYNQHYQTMQRGRPTAWAHAGRLAKGLRGASTDIFYSIFIY